MRFSNFLYSLNEQFTRYHDYYKLSNDEIKLLNTYVYTGDKKCVQAAGILLGKKFYYIILLKYKNELEPHFGTMDECDGVPSFKYIINSLAFDSVIKKFWVQNTTNCADINYPKVLSYVMSVLLDYIEKNPIFIIKIYSLKLAHKQCEHYRKLIHKIAPQLGYHYISEYSDNIKNREFVVFYLARQTNESLHPDDYYNILRLNNEINYSVENDKKINELLNAGYMPQL